MDEEKIRRAIWAMVKDKIPLNSTWCTVKAVDGQKCSVLLDELLIENILLGFDKSGVIVYPAVDSDVLVGFIDNTKTNGVVLLASVTDRIEIFGNGFNGLVKLNELVDNLTQLKQYVETMKNAVGDGLAAVGVGSAANGNTGKATFASIMGSMGINLRNMENEKVKHGDGT